MTFTLTAPGYRDIGLEHWLLSEHGAYDPVGRRLADRHYNRRKIGAPQFVPPGQRFVLVTPDLSACWAWWRPHPNSGIEQMNGLSGWTCTIFRNEGTTLSSTLVLDAERAISAQGFGCGPDGLLTYIWDAKVSSPNPGYCFKCAGWVTHPTKPRSADKKKTLLWKPFHLAGASVRPLGATHFAPVGEVACSDSSETSGKNSKLGGNSTRGSRTSERSTQRDGRVA